MFKVDFSFRLKDFVCVFFAPIKKKYDWMKK